jgi:hypothetical protein
MSPSGWWECRDLCLKVACTHLSQVVKKLIVSFSRGYPLERTLERTLKRSCAFGEAWNLTT